MEEIFSSVKFLGKRLFQNVLHRGGVQLMKISILFLYGFLESCFGLTNNVCIQLVLTEGN